MILNAEGIPCLAQRCRFLQGPMYYEVEFFDGSYAVYCAEVFSGVKLDIEYGANSRAAVEAATSHVIEEIERIGGAGGWAALDAVLGGRRYTSTQEYVRDITETMTKLRRLERGLASSPANLYPSLGILP